MVPLRLVAVARPINTAFHNEHFLLFAIATWGACALGSFPAGEVHAERK